LPEVGTFEVLERNEKMKAGIKKEGAEEIREEE